MRTRRIKSDQLPVEHAFYWGSKDWVELDTTETGKHRPRRAIHLCEAGSGVHFGVHDTSIETAFRGILERIFLVKGLDGYVRCPKPVVGVFKRLNNFTRKLVRNVPSTATWTYQQFVDSYTGRKHNVYDRAVDSLLTRGVRKSDSYMSTFVKAEKLNLSAKPDPTPRVIQPRSAVFNAAIGVFIKPMEAPIYHGIADIYGEPTVFKGMNAYQQGKLMAKKWGRFASPVAVGIDASRFDQHVSRECLEWEHSVYRALNGDPEFAHYLSWQLVNRGFVRAHDGTIKYSVEGSRMSGDMNTALGNCLIMCALVWEYMHSLDITVDDFALANNGDDCVVIFEDYNLTKFMDKLEGYFLDYGFEMTVEAPVYELEGIEFCQCHPVYTPDGYIMVRNENVARSKDLITFKYAECSTRAGWDLLRRAISEGGLSLAGNIPVMNEFYAALGRGAENACVNLRNHRSSERKLRGNRYDSTYQSGVTGFDMLAVGMSPKFETPCDETRLSFWRAFGLSPDEQEALEQEYRNITPTWDTPAPGIPGKLTI